MTYELWDTETRNRVAVFASQEDALAAVRHTFAAQGRASAETLLLGSEDDDGEGKRIAAGHELLTLAFADTHPNGDSSGTDTPTTPHAHATETIPSDASSTTDERATRYAITLRGQS